MVRGRARSPKVGLFQEGSHRIVDIPHCPIHHRAINEVAAELKRAIREIGVAPYAERPHRGALRAVQVVVERTTGLVQVTLVGSDPRPDPLEPLAERLFHAMPDGLKSLWWNGQPDRTNAILGSRWHHWRGAETVVEPVAGVDVHYPPGAFGQSHPEIAGRIAESVQARVADGSRVVELYAGCGALTLGLLPRVAALHLNERDEHGLRGLERSLAGRPARERARCRVWPGPAEAALDALADADVVVVDPPRRGLEAAVRDALGRASASKLIYVSCGIESLVRDAAVLETGGWWLSDLSAFDAFPYTAHVESLAVFERRAAHA
jgi:tRNA/tmRNA/rRNA uracil-C5-methylase (TrmA/RlmC/RlmD family)